MERLPLTHILLPEVASTCLHLFFLSCVFQATFFLIFFFVFWTLHIFSFQILSGVFLVDKQYVGKICFQGEGWVKDSIPLLCGTKNIYLIIHFQLRMNNVLVLFRIDYLHWIIGFKYLKLKLLNVHFQYNILYKQLNK